MADEEAQRCAQAQQPSHTSCWLVLQIIIQMEVVCTGQVSPGHVVKVKSSHSIEVPVCNLPLFYLPNSSLLSTPSKSVHKADFVSYKMRMRILECDNNVAVRNATNKLHKLLF